MRSKVAHWFGRAEPLRALGGLNILWRLLLCGGESCIIVLALGEDCTLFEPNDMLHLGGDVVLVLGAHPGDRDRWDSVYLCCDLGLRDVAGGGVKDP